MQQRWQEFAGRGLEGRRWAPVAWLSSFATGQDAFCDYIPVIPHSPPAVECFASGGLV